MTYGDLSFLHGEASEVAPRLLGCELERTIDGNTIRVRIVETEAYDQSDVASHSYTGQTPRTKIMFGKAGFLYVYFTYGMHYCCNVVTGPDGYGSAVLIRAVEPITGESIMESLRAGHTGLDLRKNRLSPGIPEERGFLRKSSPINLTNGPAKLCQALAIDKDFNAHDLRQSPLQLIGREPIASHKIVQTTRIGISRGKDVPWRFYIKNNPYVSKH